MKSLIFLVAAAALNVQAGVYQCTDPNGRKTFSQYPCGQNAEKLDVKGPDKLGSSGYESIRKMGVELGNDSKIKQLDREIRDAREEVLRHEANMNRELDLLRQKKRYANNNLAGAEWENSISNEMQAVVQKHQSRIDGARERVKFLQEEKRNLRL